MNIDGIAASVSTAKSERVGGLEVIVLVTERPFESGDRYPVDRRRKYGSVRFSATAGWLAAVRRREAAVVLADGGQQVSELPDP